MSEMKKNKISARSSSGQSIARKKHVSNQISSHRKNSAQTLSQITDAEIQKHTGHTKVIDEDKHIRVKINLHRLTSEILRDISKNSTPAIRDLIGGKESDTMYGAAQKSMTGNQFSVAKLNKDMPAIQEFINGKESTSSQSAFNISTELLSAQLHELLGDSELSNTSIANEEIVATFSFENNNAEINDAHVVPDTHKQLSEPYGKIICIPFHYNKTSKRNKRNLYWSVPSLVCNISDLIQPVVAEGIVDRNNKSLVISIVPSHNMKTRRRNRLTYKVQYRMSLKSKIYPDKSDKTNEVVRQLKRKPALPIPPVIYEDDTLSCTEIMSKRIKLSLTQGPLDFLIPISAIVGVYRYTSKCVAERITFEEVSFHTHESWIDNSNEKLRYELAIGCETLIEKEMDANIQKQRKRYVSEDLPFENKRKCLPAIEYHDINKNEEFIHSMRTQKDVLKKNDDDRIITSRNKPIDMIEKYQKDASVSKRVNGNLTQNAKFSREIQALTKNIPWDFALRTCQIVMPVTVELDKVDMSKSFEKLTNEITIPEVVDEEEDNVLQTQNALETSTSSNCTMITVSETNIMESDVGEIVKEECNTVSNENVLSMPDIEIDDYDTETDDSVESCSDDEFLYPLPKEGSIWQITIDDSGAVIYENIRPGDTDTESANEESESEDKQVANQLTYKENQDDEFPILDTIKSCESDAETEKYEEEEIAKSDIKLNVIDEEKITISELKTELCNEENSFEIDVSNEEKKPIFENLFFDDDNTVELDIKSLSNIKKRGELDSGAEVVDKRQTVDTDVKSNPSKEEISMKMHAESHSYNEKQTIKLGCKMNNNNEIHDNPADGTKINNNSEHDKLVKSSPITNQNVLNFHTYPENQNVIKSSTPEIRRTSSTTFEICFNDFQETTSPNHQPEVVLENVLKETNIINDVSSYAQKKEGKIIILEDKIVKLDVSGVSSEKQRNIDCQGMSMVLQNTTEQTEDQSVTKNDHQPLTTVSQQQVTRETQQPLIKQVQQPDTREFSQPRQPVIEERRQPVTVKPQELVTTQPQLPVTIASSGIVQTVVNNQNSSIYAVPVIATNVIIQNATENQMPRVALQMAGVPVSISYLSGYAQNYNEMHQILNSQIPSISTVQATQRSETGELNHNLPNPDTAQNIQHQQNGPIAGGNHGETVKVISLNDKDIRGRQYNENQVSHMPSQENNMVKHNLYQNPVAQHINQTSMIPNNYPKPNESARSVVPVNQHTGNAVPQMQYQGHNMIPQNSNQHFGNPQNRQMPKNQAVQRGQHQPRENTSYKEMNVPRMDLPRTSMVAQQNNQTQIVTNQQPIPEPTRNGLIHSTQSDPMLPMSNNGGTMGENGINMKQNPPIQHVNNPYAVVPYRNGNNLPSRNVPVQHNGAAINNNNNHQQPSIQNQPPYLPPSYPEHAQYNTQPLPSNNKEHTSQCMYRHCIHSNYMYRRILIDQQNQLQAMNMKIEELHEALQKQTTTTPRRGRKKKDNDDEAIPPVVPNYTQQRSLENGGQKVMSTRVPPEDQDLTYRNHIARNDSQQAGPVPGISSEEQRLAYLNHLARNNAQQAGSVPYIPSEEQLLAYIDHLARNNGQQVGSMPYNPAEEQRLAYLNHLARNNFQQAGPVPGIPAEEQRLAYLNHLARHNFQHAGPVAGIPSEEQRLAYLNHLARNNAQKAGPVPGIPSEEQRLAYLNNLARNNAQKASPVPGIPSEEQRLACGNNLARNNAQKAGPVPDIPSEEQRLAYLNNIARNNAQKPGPVPGIPSEEQRLAYLNHLAQNNAQRAGPVPGIPSEEQRLAYLNHLARNNAQQASAVPGIPSEEQRLAYLNNLARNNGQQVSSVPSIPSEEQRLAYLNNLARNNAQKAGPVPGTPSEEQRLAYRNHLARNNAQQVGSVPNVPSEENYLKHPNQPSGMDSQQVFSVPLVPPKEQYMKYRKRPAWKDSHEVCSTPFVSPEESSTKYPNRLSGIDSQQVRPVTRTHVEEQNLRFPNRPPGMDSQHVRPVPFSDLEKQYLQYINRAPVQQGTQERYPITSGQLAGSARNVLPAQPKHTYYPKPEVPASQNVSMLQPSVPLGTPSLSTSRHQPQESQPVNIYNRPVRNEDATKLHNLHADKMHAQAQSNSSVNQLSNENGPINLSIHDKNERNKPQQYNNVSDQTTPNATGRNINYQTGSEYMKLEALRNHIQKKQNAAPRNKSRDSGYIGSPEEGRL